MSKIYTPDNAQNLNVSKGLSEHYEIVDASNLTDCYSKITVKHKVCNHTFTIVSDEFFNKRRGCPCCAGNLETYHYLYVIKLWDDLNKDKEYELLSFVEGKKQQAEITVRHKDCDFVSSMKCVDFFKQSFYCKKCSGKLKYTPDTIEKTWNESGMGVEYEFVNLILKSKRAKIEVKHRTCGFQYVTDASGFFRKKSKCRRCIGTARKYTKENFLNVWGNTPKTKDYNLIDFSKVTCAKSFFTIQCNKCQRIYDIRVHNFFNHDDGCARCSRVEQKYTQENFPNIWETSPQKEDFELLDYSNVTRAKDKFTIKHKKCGFVFNVDCGNFFYQNTGCPNCQRSRGEEIVTKILEDLNVPYNWQWLNHNCVIKKKAKFDFFLPNHGVIIEYNGSQHYKPTRRFGGWSEFETIIHRDQIKRQWCKDNGIRFLEIPYWYNTYEDIKWFLENNLPELF